MGLGPRVIVILSNILVYYGGYDGGATLALKVSLSLKLHMGSAQKGPVLSKPKEMCQKSCGRIR